MYELTYIATPLIGELDLNAMVEKIRGFINGLGAEIKSEKIGEKRKLAYPIEKQAFGYYVTTEFKLNSEKIEELRKDLGTTADILRFLLIYKDAETEPMKRTAPKISEKLIENLEKIDITSEKPAKPKKSEKKEKVKIEELDKKLDEILGE